MIIGHTRNLAYLSRVLERGTLAHAYLFQGPEGVGKRSVALAVAKALLCERQRPELDSCGLCGSCRHVETLTHPDLLILSPEQRLIEEESVEIGIKNIRELARRLSLTPWAGGWRAVIIDQAERVSREAQSALLKTLEEPGSQVIFFLITSAPGALLPTITSRAVGLAFTPVDDALLGELLADVPHARRAELLGLAAGRPGMLARLIRDHGYAQALRLERAAFLKLLSSSLPEQLAAADRASREPGWLESFLTFAIGELRSRLTAALDVEGATFPAGAGVWGQAELLQRLGERLVTISTVPVNRRLAVDGVFVELAARGILR